MEETTLQTARSVPKEGEEVIHMPEHRFSPAAWGKDHDEAAVPLQPIEILGGAEFHLQSMEDTRAGAGRCALHKTAVHARFLAVTSRVMYAGTAHPWKSGICRKDPCWTSL